MVAFMGLKNKTGFIGKYLTYSSAFLLAVVTGFIFLGYFYLNNLAAQQRLVLVKMGNVVFYVPSEPVLCIYIWNIFWISSSLCLANVLRIWMSCTTIYLTLTAYLVFEIFSQFFSWELSIFSLTYIKTWLIYSLLLVQQKIARRDINDRGYEVHQNQFNLIYRRVLHIST
jgi:hypothetical protein